MQYQRNSVKTIFSSDNNPYQKVVENRDTAHKL